MVLITCFFFNVEGLYVNRMLFVCDIFNIHSYEKLNKNHFMSLDTLIFIIYQYFGMNIEILYNVGSSVPFRGNF